jgi:hypothetical protein
MSEPKESVMGEKTVPESWEEHHHEALVHDHRHYHVTHNYNDLTTGFDHLSSTHSHEHDHGELTHRHHPHVAFETEHLGEAHVHDHEVPVKLEALKKTQQKRPARAAGKPSPPSAKSRTAARSTAR